MSRKQHTGRGAISRYNPGRGRKPIFVNVRDPLSLIYGAHRLFGFLAYPGEGEKESQQRNRFLLDLEAEMWRKHREMGGDVRTTLNAPLKVLRRTKRQIHGGWFYGFNRIATRRLLAAQVATPIFDGGFIVRRTTTEGIVEMVRKEPLPVNEALRRLWLQKEEHQYGWQLQPVADSKAGRRRYDIQAADREREKNWQDDRFQNFKRFVWHESMPVLPLAMALRKVLLTYRPDLPIEARGYLLLKDLSWVCAALEYADGWVLPELRKSIPEFDPANAVRIIPIEPIPSPGFSPAALPY